METVALRSIALSLLLVASMFLSSTASAFHAQSKINADQQKLAVTAVSSALSTSQAALSKLSALSKGSGLAAGDKSVLKDCVDTFGTAVDQIRDSLKELKALTGNGASLNNAQTWMSAAISDQETCNDGLGEAKVSAALKSQIQGLVATAEKSTSSALSIVNKI